MTMSPEERRRRMHRALNKANVQRSSRAKADNGNEIPDIDISGSETEGTSAYAEDAGVSVQHRRTRMRSAEAQENVSDRRSRRAPADDSSLDDAGTAYERKQSRSRTEDNDDSGERSRQAADRRRSRGNDSADSARKRSGSGNRARRRRSEGPNKLFILIAALVCILVIVFAVKAIVGAVNNRKQARLESESASIAESSIAESESESESIAEESGDDLERAKLMFAQYDYDNAIDLLKSLPNYDENTEAQELVAKCEETRATLEEQDIYKITHIFFHILCVDPENSFDESKWGTQAGGYNSLMTTISEFEKMIQEMYDKGYVLVSLHDIAHEETQADGTTKMVKGSIMLPPGKKAFVMSEDDVCYYEYMEGAGYADKMIVGDDGRPTLHYTDKDGNEFVGDYDLVLYLISL